MAVGRARIRVLLASTLALSGYALHATHGALRRPPVARMGPPVAAAINPDWRAFRAGLIDTEEAEAGSPPSSEAAAPPVSPPSPFPDAAWWVHELVSVERGCVLLAQPGAIFPEQPLMHRAAVLVLEHSETRGTVGILLERPTNRTLASLLERKPDSNLSPFAKRPLMIGGNVLQPRRGIRVLTRRCDVAGGVQILYGLYECSPAAAKHMIAIGAARSDEFHFFAAACQWAPKKLQSEVEAAAWVPVAASAEALFARDDTPHGLPHRGADHTSVASQPPAPPPAPPPPSALSGKDEIYFSLMEGIGGEYARLARATRTNFETDEWLQGCAERAAGEWRDLATRVVEADTTDFAAAGPSGSSFPGGAKGGLGAAAPTATPAAPPSGGGEAVLTIESAALSVHRALYLRDNVSDIWEGLASLSEQASYIWFTREIDLLMAPGSVELPPKDPMSVSETLRHGDSTGMSRGKRGGKGAIFKGGKRAGGGSQHGALPARSRPKASGHSPVPKVRVVPASEAYAYSKENGLLALNLLLFEVMGYMPRERGDATAEQCSLVHLVRRSGGPAALFMLCVLYAAVARRLGIPLQLVTLELPPVLRGRGPAYLLRLPAADEQAELYIDVLANGRLRGPWDLAAYANEDALNLGLDRADKDVLAAQMREYVREVTPADFCVRQISELADACEAAEAQAEASFWHIQNDALTRQIEIAQAEEAERRGSADTE